MNSLDFKEMLCPVCENFFFSKLQEGDDVNSLQCHHCGWKYDISQAQNFNLKNGKNEKSVNELKTEYADKIANNPDFDYSEETYEAIPHKCPVCGKYKFEDEASFDVCPFCGWEDDGIMEEEPDKWAGTANDLCLNDYRQRYKSFLKIKPDYKYSRDKYF